MTPSTTHCASAYGTAAPEASVTLCWYAPGISARPPQVLGITRSIDATRRGGGRTTGGLAARNWKVLAWGPGCRVTTASWTLPTGAPFGESPAGGSGGGRPEGSQTVS